VLYADYETRFAVIEFIGEWNDALYNDIMFLKREIIESMTGNGINKFILIGEMCFNFHGSDDCYYEEWFQDVDDGWVAPLISGLMCCRNSDAITSIHYLVTGGELDNLNWRDALTRLSFL
jgi:hypothetical protein